jgi:hypothetical protein
VPSLYERTGVEMVTLEHNEPKIDEMLYNWIKMGYNSVDDLMKLKHDYELDTIAFVEALTRLEEFNLITRTKNKFLVNGTIEF